MDKILLVFAPLGNHEHPHLGLPLLKGYLLNHGISNCIVKDYNVVIMDRIIVDLMTGNRKTLFGKKDADVLKLYRGAKEIMRGRTSSDKLKSGWAMDFISNYLRIAGGCIGEISFDPISFRDIEKEFQRTDMISSDNAVINYIRDEVVEDILQNNPRVLGFSIVFASQIYYTLLICREIRKLKPDIKIVFGGPQVSLFWKAFTSSEVFAPYFDVIVREQGEAAILSLCNHWLKGIGSLESIPNIIYKDKSLTYKANPIGQNIDMDNVAVPDFRDMPLELYSYAKLPYMMTRGCYWGRCAFCGYRGSLNRYLTSSKEKIISDIKTLKERHNIRIYHLMDDAIDPIYLLDVANEIIKTDLDITYAAFLRTERAFTKKVCDVLYKSGLKAVLFGFESANQRVLDIMNKHMNLDTMTEVLLNFKNAGISNYLSCIIGFPTETRSEAYDTIRFLQERKDLYYKAYITPFRLLSDMEGCPENFSVDSIDFTNPMRHDRNGYVSLEYHYRVNEGMSIEESLEVMREARIKVNSVPPGPIFFR